MTAELSYLPPSAQHRLPGSVLSPDNAQDLRVANQFVHGRGAVVEVAKYPRSEDVWGHLDANTGGRRPTYAC